MKVSLQSYNNSWYNPGRGAFVRFLWYYTNSIFFESRWFPYSGMKSDLLRLFGATLGTNVTIKPCVNIKYPWHLKVGNNVWVGENVWIDNLTKVSIGDNCCLSQGAMLLTGNHDFSLPTFDLMIKEIILEDGVWLGAKSVVCPGVRCKSHSVLTVGSIATRDLESFGIYRGNPAEFLKNRVITTALKKPQPGIAPKAR
jgi:putative colanic acid biosynthesis acetyltransferase WcaF